MIRNTNLNNLACWGGAAVGRGHAVAVVLDGQLPLELHVTSSMTGGAVRAAVGGWRGGVVSGQEPSLLAVLLRIEAQYVAQGQAGRLSLFLLFHHLRIIV